MGHQFVPNEMVVALGEDDIVKEALVFVVLDLVLSVEAELKRGYRRD